MTPAPPALQAVLPSLECPVCAGRLGLSGSVASCQQGHTFDVARQGYLNLLTGGGGGTADTAGMVEARARLLAAGHYGRLATAVAETVTAAVPTGGEPLLVDLAAGTGYYLATALDALGRGRGLAVDVSRPALKRAARAHPLAAAIGADAWGRLPVVAGAASAVLSVFGPRQPAEMARILRPGGVIVVLTPAAEHLRELAGPLGLIGIEPEKEQRVDRAFALVASPAGTQRLAYTAVLSPADALDIAAMGPTARHVRPDELAARAAALPDPVEVTVAARLAWYRVGA